MAGGSWNIMEPALLRTDAVKDAALTLREGGHGALKRPWLVVHPLNHYEYHG